MINIRMRIAYAALAVLIAAAALGGSVESPSLDISWSTVDSGGGVSFGTSLQLYGTIGQHDASPSPMIGNQLSMVGGFWPSTDGGTQTCQADPTGDGLVNIDDLLLVINNWGQGPGSPGDIDQMGGVNIDDLLAIVNAWGACP
jgi:hypothetical protein